MRLSIFLPLFAVLLSPIAFAETLSVEQLDKKVYKLNNEMKYKESQSLLLPLLSRKDLTSSYKFEVCLLLSYTYKRVYDYQSTMKFLDEALKYASESTEKERCEAVILSEKAFVLFDTQQYEKSDQIMRKLAETNYRHIDVDNQAVLVMQQAYLHFLEKDYSVAERMYDDAIELMKRGSSCNLPMIYVKKMQMYAGMGNMSKALKAYRISGKYADSCNIIKYRIYASEELEAIYKKQRNFEAAGAVSVYLDSLKSLYEKEEHIAELHAEKETFLLNNKNNELKQSKASKNRLKLWLLVAVVSFFVVGLVLIRYRKQKKAIETDFELFRESLLTHLAQENVQSKDISELQIDPRAIQSDRKSQEKLLSERQIEVLECLREGMINKEIAAKLYISENTVKYHIKGIYQALQINDRKELLN